MFEKLSRWLAPPPRVPDGKLDYLQCLARVHAHLRPERYFEIGCRKGHSLALSRCESLAVDPAFRINVTLEAPCRLMRETSDEFFERADPCDLLGGAVDLAFIDGMHLVEFALRDFMNVERVMAPGGVIALDDVLPADLSWASRVHRRDPWTGDVYRLIPLLRELRPDLAIAVFDVDIKGLALITRVNPADQTLPQAYAGIEARLAAGAFRFEDAQSLRAAVAPEPGAAIESWLDAHRLA